jgi:hypothetical protein
MSLNRKNIIPSKYLENTTTTQYTAMGVKCYVENFSVTNVSASPVTFDVYLVPASGTAGATNQVIKSQSVFPNESFEPPVMVGKILDSGGFIATNCSASSALVCNASGTEIS